MNTKGEMVSSGMEEYMMLKSEMEKEGGKMSPRIEEEGTFGLGRESICVLADCSLGVDDA